MKTVISTTKRQWLCCELALRSIRGDSCGDLGEGGVGVVLGPAFPIMAMFFSRKLSSEILLLVLKMHFVTERITMLVQTIFLSIFRSARNRLPKVAQIITTYVGNRELKTFRN